VKQCPLDKKDKRTWLELIVEAIIRQAVRGNLGAFSEIADRTDGKPAQSVQLHADVMTATTELSVTEAKERIVELTERIRARVKGAKQSASG
jgi:hypothetical protein